MAKNYYLKMFGIFIAALAIVGGAAYVFMGGVQFAAAGGGGGDAGAACAASGGTWANNVCTPASSNQCFQTPAIAVLDSDAQNAGTIITSPTIYYRYNGGYAATTAPSFKTSASLLITNTSFLNKIVNNVAFACGNNSLIVTQDKLANATISVYSNDQLSKLTNAAAGGAYNESAAAAGNGYSWKMHFQGVDKKTTGKMLVILEISSKTNVSGADLSGATAASVPNGYSTTLTNAFTKAWIIDEVYGNSQVDHWMTVGANSGYIVNGAVYITVYSMQPFVDTDGAFITPGVTQSQVLASHDVLTAFDSANAAKSATTNPYAFLIK